MISTENIQNDLFQRIKESRTSEVSFVDEISDLLNISIDSAYRRLRGETALTLSEIKKICNNYHLSIDSFLNVKSDSIIFNYKWAIPEEFEYTAYLRAILKDMDIITSFGDNEMIFHAKDFPMLYNFLIPEIGEFKGFFWQKTVLQKEHFRNKKFDVDQLSNENIKLGYEIAKKYTQVSSSELWNDEIFNSILRQVEYYHESDYMSSYKDTETLLDKVDQLISHFQLQAEKGSKFLINKDGEDHPKNLKLYYNEVIIGDNTLLFRSGEDKIIYKAHNIISSIATRDKDFCDHTWDIKQNLISHSTLISSNAEKERIKFFNRLRRKVSRLRNKLLEE